MITIKQVLAEAKKAGLTVTKAGSTLNGAMLYRINGHVGLFSINGLIELLDLGFSSSESE
jgi:hypothetical protein